LSTRFTDAKQVWNGQVIETALSAGVRAGGQTAFSRHAFEGTFPNKPIVALEVNDVLPAELEGMFGESVGRSLLGDPIAWARMAVEGHGSDLLFFNMLATHQDRQNIGAEQAAETLNAILEAVDTPVIVRPSGNYEKQNRVITKCAERAIRPVVLGSAVQDNYRAITAAAMAGGHFLVAESPIDVNIAKQVNILVTQMSFPIERIIMDPMTGGLGYGFEYTYSVMERIRLQAFQADRLMSPPIVCFVGPEIWKIKEIKTQDDALGDRLQRAVHWEVATALGLLLAGADILCVRHPRSVAALKASIASLHGGS
jgi:acetyl-CoA decarbonylase/synthase complex subunit delta